MPDDPTRDRSIHETTTQLSSKTSRLVAESYDQIDRANWLIAQTRRLFKPVENLCLAPFPLTPSP